MQHNMRLIALSLQILMELIIHVLVESRMCLLLYSNLPLKSYKGYAPRATTSFIFPRIDRLTFSWVAKPMTGVPSSIKAIVPCFNSPPANPSA